MSSERLTARKIVAPIAAAGAIATLALMNNSCAPAEAPRQSKSVVCEVIDVRATATPGVFDANLKWDEADSHVSLLGSTMQFSYIPDGKNQDDFPVSELTAATQTLKLPEWHGTLRLLAQINAPDGVTYCPSVPLERP